MTVPEASLGIGAGVKPSGSVVSGITAEAAPAELLPPLPPTAKPRPAAKPNPPAKLLNENEAEDMPAELKPEEALETSGSSSCASRVNSDGSEGDSNADKPPMASATCAVSTASSSGSVSSKTCSCSACNSSSSVFFLRRLRTASTFFSDNKALPRWLSGKSMEWGWVGSTAVVREAFTVWGFAG